MPRILVDACGWVALVDAAIHIENGFADVTGPVVFVVTEGVAAELERLATRRQGLLLDMLLTRCERIDDPDGTRHVDDGLIDIASRHGWPVLTVDRRLKQRLVDAGCSYVEVTASRTLRLVE